MTTRTLNPTQLRQEQDTGTPYEWNEHDDLSAELAARGYEIDLTLTPGEALIAQVRALAADRQAALENQHEVTRLKALESELPNLREFADLGRRYRSELIDEALAEGRTAMGATFTEAPFRAMLEGASVEQIKVVRDDWRRSTENRTHVARVAVRPPVLH